MKKFYIAGYHQSQFGKLLDISIPEIVAKAIRGACNDYQVDPSAIDVGSIGATCHISLNEQGLLSGLMAEVDGLSGKPLESVENACASGGQAILSVIQKLALGWGEIGIAVGYEKMRDAHGRMDGRKIGEALGYFSHPDERVGKTYVFPHLFAEVMRDYMAEHDVSEEDLAAIAVQEYFNASYNPYAQMRDIDLTLEQALTIEGINRYIVDGLPMKTYDCSQISDGYASLLIATDEGLQKLGIPKSETVEIAGFAQATDPLGKEKRDVLRPAGAFHAMRKAYDRAGVTSEDVKVSEIHDCFTVMGALGVEVLGKAAYGEGARLWTEGRTAPDGDSPVNTSGGLIAKGHPIGASGIAMVGWCAWQILHQVPQELQVQNADIAATFNIGGPICASVCTVLKAPS